MPCHLEHVLASKGGKGQPCLLPNAFGGVLERPGDGEQELLRSRLAVGALWFGRGEGLLEPRLELGTGPLRQRKKRLDVRVHVRGQRSKRGHSTFRHQQSRRRRCRGNRRQ